MTSEQYQQTLRLRWGAPVVLNIGLGPAFYKIANTMGPAQRAVIARHLLHEVLEEGYICFIETTGEEPTLVVLGTFRDNVDRNLLLWDMLRAVEQDCCAIYYPDTKAGVLYGEYADRWGEFDITKFIQPKDKHDN